MSPRNQRYRARRRLVLAAAVLGCGCDRTPSANGLPSGSSSTSALTSRGSALSAPQSASASAGALASADPRLAPGSAVVGARGSASSGAANAPPPEGELHLGPAMAVTFGARGAVAVTQADELVVAPFKDGSVAAAGELPGPLAAVAPAITGGGPERVYWLSKGRLVRRQLSADGAVGVLEELAKDAASGVPVAALRTAGQSGRDLVLYAGAPEGSEGARAPRLWVEGQGSRRLSQEAGSATSVALVRVGADGMFAFSLDGRLGNSSVHAVRLTVDGEGKVNGGEDHVVYVGGSAEPSTPLAGLAVGQLPVVFLPMPTADPIAFGLVSLLVRDETSEAATSWLDYPNGLDPAPVATAVVCDRPRVAFVRPERTEPGSPQRLELGEVTSNGQVTAVRTLATAKRIVHVALGAAGPTRAWIAYATDAGLSAQPLDCALRR